MDAIVRAAHRVRPKTIVEIGAGPGLLTRRLAEQDTTVFAIERDDRFIPVLQEQFKDHPRVHVVHGDALEQDFGALAEHSTPSVVGNLPYNISTPLLLRMLEQKQQTGPATVMLQREVAQRLNAKANTKTYGSLSVLFQAHANLEKVCDVSPESFVPKPTIWSTVLQLDWLPNPKIPIRDPALFHKVVRAAFSQRRKMLRNSLRTAFDESTVLEAAEHAELDLRRRAESLNLQEFGLLADGFSQANEKTDAAP